MILKIAGIVSVLVCLHKTDGASYSKVYVQSGGSDVVPVEYVNYGPPVVAAEPQIARLAAAPIGPVVSSVIPPCVSPCVVGKNVAPIAPVPNAKFITYNAPNVPVVVAPSKDNGYEYSYVVYDDNTGDRKAQREFSDGSVVRGEYSFIQPDGYVREVQYTADDLNGFNVVVKKSLPDTAGAVEKKQEKVDLPPCKEVKSEALKVEPPKELVKETVTEKKVVVTSESPKNSEHGTPGHECHDHDGNGIEDHLSKDHVEKAEVIPIGVKVTSKVEDHAAIKKAPVESVPELVESPKASENIVQATRVEIKEPIAIPDQSTPKVAPALPALPVPAPPIPGSNLVVSYEDIIRCLQSKSQVPQGLNVSPLTYIILPSANRPC